MKPYCNVALQETGEFLFEFQTASRQVCSHTRSGEKRSGAGPAHAVPWSSHGAGQQMRLIQGSRTTLGHFLQFRKHRYTFRCCSCAQRVQGVL
jgi:hypothetical protein